ncbi:MAG: NlpC/P60 family protein [bacterium]
MKKIGLFFLVFVFIPLPLQGKEVVQVGAFEQKSNARRRAERLENWGVKTKLTRSSEDYYRVRTKKITGEELAQLTGKLEEREIPYFTVETKNDSSNHEKKESKQDLVTLDKLKEKIDSVRGITYRWGGQKPTRGFDCSGLLYWLFGGDEIPRTVSEMWIWVEKIEKENMRPGDLVFFNFNSPGKQKMPDHVGLYTGEGEFVHASEEYGVITVEFSRNYYESRLVGIGRPPLELIRRN